LHKIFFSLASPLELVRELLVLRERIKFGFRAPVLAPRSGVLDDRRRRRAHHAAIGDRAGELLLPLTSSAPELVALRHLADVLSSKSMNWTPFFAAAVGHGEVVRHKEFERELPHSRLSLRRMWWEMGRIQDTGSLHVARGIHTHCPHHVPWFLSLSVSRS